MGVALSFRQHKALIWKHLIVECRSKWFLFVRLSPPLWLIIYSVVLSSFKLPGVSLDTSSNLIVSATVHQPVHPAELSLPPPCGNDLSCRRILWGPYSKTNWEKMNAFAHRASLSISPPDYTLETGDHVNGSSLYDISCYNRGQLQNGSTIDFLPDLDWITLQGLYVRTWISFSKPGYTDLKCPSDSLNCTLYIVGNNETAGTNDPLTMEGRRWSHGTHIMLQSSLYEMSVGEPPNFTFSTKAFPTIDANLDKGYLKSMGVIDWVYWSSWYLFHLSIYTVVVLVIISLGLTLPNVQLFRQTDLGVLMLLFFSYGCASIAFSMAWSTIFRRTFVGFSGGFLWYLATTNGGYYNTNLLGQISSEPIVSYDKLFYLLPFWHFNRFLSIIEYITDPYNHMSKEFTPHDMYRHAENVTQSGPRTLTVWDTVEPAMYHIVGLWVNTIVYIIIMLYLDQVLKDKNKMNRPFFFFLSPSYWLGGRGRQLTLRNPPYHPDPDVRQEYERLKDGKCILKINGLSKAYVKKTWMCGKKTFKPALNDIFLTGEIGTILAVLGHNGAGKSTLIDVSVVDRQFSSNFQILTGKKSFTG
ncbi:hypothetical protein PROFUN_04185 [Planoprotostelium fungivorum]|uniref:ABC-2 type transporter transmembrane domain-containing protein n=1 Tax=Planoprotostelium fungivorum TaxID=1890364 RepID=A0A2P6NVV6_9EUKA|nr:hypothetical protein PROFUN_04185 [Planoprotostelium fungivorum]